MCLIGNSCLKHVNYMTGLVDSFLHCNLNSQPVCCVNSESVSDTDSDIVIAFTVLFMSHCDSDTVTDNDRSLMIPRGRSGHWTRGC